MGALVWVMTSLAIWHFTVYLPDRFWGGIAGAFVAALIGGFVVALLINGLTVPGQSETSVTTLLEALPGTALGMGLAYWKGSQVEKQLDPELALPTHRY